MGLAAALTAPLRIVRATVIIAAAVLLNADAQTAASLVEVLYGNLGPSASEWR